MIAILQWPHFLFLPPICLAIAIVTAAAHRDDIREILRHSMRAWVILLLGIGVFAFTVSMFFEWVLPG